MIQYLNYLALFCGSCLLGLTIIIGTLFLTHIKIKDRELAMSVTIVVGIIVLVVLIFAFDNVR